MSDDEAARFTEAYREVKRHFPVPSIDPKWVALGTFAYVAYGVYAPRVAAVAAKKRGGGKPAASVPPVVSATSGYVEQLTPSQDDWFAGSA